MAINFFNEEISYTVRKKGKLRSWIGGVVGKEGRIAGELNFIFCNDGYLSKLNFKYLKHKTLTDIITFPYESEEGFVSGDIFISLPRVKENASIFKQGIEDELHRVMVHGVLHLIGYNDASASEKQTMREKEDYYLSALISVE